MIGVSASGEICSHDRVRRHVNWVSDGKGDTKPAYYIWRCEDCDERFHPDALVRALGDIAPGKAGG